MPNDYYANKVVFGDTTIMDISDTTASPEDVAEGEIFYAANGARSVGTGAGGGYVLPIASAEVLGGVKVGSNLSIDSNGVLSANGGGGTSYTAGDGIDIENTTISLDIDYLTASRLGVIPVSEKGVNNGVATLNNNGKIPDSQLPQYGNINAVEITQEEYDVLPKEEKSDPTKIYFIGEEANKFNPITWDNFTDITGTYIWSDGNDIYCSYYSSQYKLNGTTWESVTWSGFTDIVGNNVWTDGSNIYYSYYNNQYELNGTTWESISWSGLTRFDGENIWTDGTNTYYSNYSDHYKLNGTTWETVTWDGLTNFYGHSIWTDGDNVYYSDSTIQYKLNGTTWEIMNWNGLTYFYGQHIWTDGNNIYYSMEYAHYKLINGTTTWESITWDGINTFYGNNIWTNGTNIYYSSGTQKQYVIIIYNPNSIYYQNNDFTKVPTASVDTLGGVKVGDNLSIDFNGVLSATGGGTVDAIGLGQSEYDLLPTSEKTNPNKIYFIGEEANKFKPITWSGLANITGGNIWTNGTDIYYSNGYNQQYILNGSTWETMIWTGFSSLYGAYVWSDGTNIYYSYGSDQYKLNGTTWESITWSGIANFDGYNIWSDGTDYYYSDSSTQYKLNGTAWESITWSGLTSFGGYNIWNDGTNIYCSNYENQYRLNGTTWETMTWSGLSDFGGSNIWTDGANIYYSEGSDQYKLNGTTWESIVWNGIQYLNGYNIWTDGTNIYYSDYTNQYKLNTKASTDGIYYKDRNFVNLPMASSDTLGGIKVGNNLSIDANGVLSSTGGGGSTYTAGDGIDIENTTISLDMEYLTASRLGVVPITEKGVNNGVATLDSSGKVPTSQLPSYVDDVLEYADLSSFPVTGESGKIYVALDTNKTYRWGGSTYVEISASLALGETTGTAYEGNKGKANADNIATIQGLIPSGASTSNKLATTNDIPSTTNFVQKSATPGLLKNDGSIDTNTYLTELPIASSNALGGIRVGNNLSIDENGILSAIGSGGVEAIELMQSDYDALPNSDKINPSKIYFIDNAVNEAEVVEWSGNNPEKGSKIWTDGTNIYYSDGSNKQYKLNGTTWETITWTTSDLLYLNPMASSIWTDGINIYYSDGNNKHYKLNGTTWEKITWGGNAEYIYGNGIWTDGTNIYYSADSNKQYELNETTWIVKSWNGFTGIKGQYIWTDGINIYYSEGSYQYKLNGNTWETIDWGENIPYWGNYVWTDGVNTYYSMSGEHYELDGTIWESINWSGVPQSFNGREIWTDGINTYYSNTDQCEIITSETIGIYYKNKKYSDLSLPIADSNTLGGIKVGNGLSIDSNGVLSTNSSGGSSGNSNLPYSNPTTIICEADTNIFNPTDNTWGRGSNPIQYMGGTPTYNSVEDAVLMPASTNGIYGYVDLGNVNTPYTAYVVMKLINPSRYSRVISCMKERSSNNGLLIYGNNAYISSWGDDFPSNISTENYFVAAIKFGTSTNSSGFINGLGVKRTPTNSGQYITLCRSDIDSSGTNAEPCDGYIKYMGVINKAEDDIVIQKNLLNLYDKYILKYPSISDYYHVYSTNERIVGTWINNKPIYEITIQNDSLSTDIDVSDLNIETIIKLDGLGADTVSDITNGSPMSGNRFTMNGTSGIQNRVIYISSNNHIKREGSYSVGAILIQYTKTTD